MATPTTGMSKEDLMSQTKLFEMFFDLDKKTDKKDYVARYIKQISSIGEQIIENYKHHADESLRKNDPRRIEALAIMDADPLAFRKYIDDKEIIDNLRGYFP